MSEIISYDRGLCNELERLISEAKDILILPHTGPDGDALGSTMALALGIEQRFRDKRVHLLSPTPVESYLAWMLPFHKVAIWQGAEMLSDYAEVDLIGHLDHNTLGRLRHEPLKEFVQTSGIKRFLIDHHLFPETNVDLMFSLPEASSTCEMLYWLLKEMNWEITPAMASCLLTGIITDTGRYLYSCSSPSTFTATSELLALGADLAYINDRLNYHAPISFLKIQSYALLNKLKIDHDRGCGIITLRLEELDRYGASPGETEGLVNSPLNIEGIQVSCFLRETPHFIKVSLRSMGDFPVNEVARLGFGGGGHLNAAGAEFYGTMEAAERKFLDSYDVIMKEYRERKNKQR